MRHEGIIVIYDGECPFCTRYVALMALSRNVGRVELIDARSADPRIIALQAAGYDLNEGMVVIYGGRTYHGSSAMALISGLCQGDWLGRALARVLANPNRAKLLYPVLRFGRALVLRAMGRSPISVGKAPVR